MKAIPSLSLIHIWNRLAAYDFRGEDVLKPVSVLSGGEQSRLRLCMLMDDEINFLIPVSYTHLNRLSGVRYRRVPGAAPQGPSGHSGGYVYGTGKSARRSEHAV